MRQGQGVELREAFHAARHPLLLDAEEHLGELLVADALVDGEVDGGAFVGHDSPPSTRPVATALRGPSTPRMLARPATTR